MDRVEHYARGGGGVLCRRVACGCAGVPAEVDSNQEVREESYGVNATLAGKEE